MDLVEFAVLLGEPGVAGETVRLAGRCHRGPIRLGDVFTEIGAGPAKHPVALRVDGLLFYGRHVTELHGGDTAQLTLSGRGAHLARLGVLLRRGATGREQ